MSINELKQQAKLCGTKKYRIITSFDERTCDTCRPFEDKVFLVAKAVPGKNLPPFHEHCRCAVALDI